MTIVLLYISFELIQIILHSCCFCLLQKLNCHYFCDLFLSSPRPKGGRSRRSLPQNDKEHKLIEFGNNLFDIAHANALSLIKLEEDKSFLLAQREKGRRGIMGSVDRKFVAKEPRKAKRK